MSSPLLILFKTMEGTEELVNLDNEAHWSYLFWNWAFMKSRTYTGQHLLKLYRNFIVGWAQTLLRAATLCASWASISGSVSALCSVCCSFCLASSSRSWSCRFFSSPCNRREGGTGWSRVHRWTRPEAGDEIKANRGKRKHGNGTALSANMKHGQAANHSQRRDHTGMRRRTCLYRESLLANSFSSLSFMSWRDVASRWAARYLQTGTKHTQTGTRETRVTQRTVGSFSSLLTFELSRVSILTSYIS